MASIRRKFSFKRDHKISDATATNGSFVDGPVNISSNQPPVSFGHKDHHFDTLAPNKGLEEKVLQNRFQYLSSNIPPDDVAIEMNTRGLLTVKEHEEYLSMKRAHTSDSTKSEYLLQCLGRRRAGFLTRFCEILKGIEQASYLADEIIEAYKRASLQMHGYNSRLGSRDRLSNLSLSDPDLYAKGEYSVQECIRCKVLERRNKKLERQCRELKEQQDVYQNIILPFTPLAEVAQEQLQRAMTEGNQLKELLPQLQRAVTESTCQMSAVQVSLGKMNEMLAQEQVRVKAKEAGKEGRMLFEGYSARNSIISESSVYPVEEDTDNFSHRTTSTGSVTHQSQQNDTEHQFEKSQVPNGSTYCEENRSTYSEEKFRLHRRKSESATASQRRNKFQLTRTTRSNEEPKSAQINMEELKSILKSRREHVDGTSNTDT